MYRLFIVTPEKVVFDSHVSSIIAPGSTGYLEILTNHAPLITILKTGNFVITDENKKKVTYTITEGYLEVLHNQVTVLADAIELATETNPTTAKAAV